MNPDETNSVVLQELRAIRREVEAINRKLDGGRVGVVSGTRQPSGGDVASDRDLDDPTWGNPTVKRDPPKWSGDSFEGHRYSECSPDFLDSLAGFKEWQAKKDDDAKATDKKGRPKGNWSRKEAALCRGWAQRLRNGWTPPAGGGAAANDESFGGLGPSDGADYGATGSDDDIPFLVPARGIWRP